MLVIAFTADGEGFLVFIFGRGKIALRRENPGQPC